MGPKSQIPQLNLPVDVTLLSHPKEKKSKSSVVPCKIIAPDNVDFVSAADAPEFRKDDESYDSVLLLFPGESAVEVTDMS